MEGKNLSFFTRPMFLVVLVLFVFVGVGVFYLWGKDYQSAVKQKVYDSEKIVVQKIDDGGRVLRNYKEGYSVEIPKVFITQTSKDRLNFYTPDLRCKFSFEEIKKEESVSIEGWIKGTKLVGDDITILSEELKYLDSENKIAIYTVDTTDIGFSKVYYMDRGQKLIQIVIYADDKNSSCYDEINNITIK